MAGTNAAYMRDYQVKKYARLRAEMLFILGGKCAVCGSAEDLEMDHIDRSTKKFSLKQLVFRKHATFLEEVAKCQLLCDPCHNKKTLADKGLEPAKGRHGTISTYRYCKCRICFAAKSKYNHDYRERSSVGSSTRLLSERS